tara:strand:+ start:191 stop:787 length:597 start_codon:yes stop_codon:yes gene_type:complete
MFGVTAFAQEPFTSLSGPFYVTSDNGIVLSDEETSGSFLTGFISETTSLSEVSVSQFAFVGADSEGVLLTSLEAVLAQFKPACLDSLTVTNTQAALAVYLGVRDELVGLSTSEDVLAAFIASLADAMTLAMALSSITHYHPTCTDLIILSDYQYGRGWFKIDDNQAITWVAVVDAQASGWSLVDDTQDPNWVNVNDIQ